MLVGRRVEKGGASLSSAEKAAWKYHADAKARSLEDEVLRLQMEKGRRKLEKEKTSPDSGNKKVSGLGKTGRTESGQLGSGGISTPGKLIIGAILGGVILLALHFCTNHKGSMSPGLVAEHSSQFAFCPDSKQREYEEVLQQFQELQKYCADEITMLRSDASLARWQLVASWVLTVLLGGALGLVITALLRCRAALALSQDAVTSQRVAKQYAKSASMFHSQELLDHLSFLRALQLTLHSASQSAMVPGEKTLLSLVYKVLTFLTRTCKTVYQILNRAYSVTLYPIVHIAQSRIMLPVGSFGKQLYQHWCGPIISWVLLRCQSRIRALVYLLSKLFQKFYNMMALTYSCYLEPFCGGKVAVARDLWHSCVVNTYFGRGIHQRLKAIRAYLWKSEDNELLWKASPLYEASEKEQSPSDEERLFKSFQNIFSSTREDVPDITKR